MFCTSGRQGQPFQGPCVSPSMQACFPARPSVYFFLNFLEWPQSIPYKEIPARTVSGNLAVEQDSVITSTEATWEAIRGAMGMGDWSGVLGEHLGLPGSQDCCLGSTCLVRFHQSSDMPT